MRRRQAQELMPPLTSGTRTCNTMKACRHGEEGSIESQRIPSASGRSSSPPRTRPSHGNSKHSSSKLPSNWMLPKQPICISSLGMGKTSGHIPLTQWGKQARTSVSWGSKSGMATPAPEANEEASGVASHMMEQSTTHQISTSHPDPAKVSISFVQSSQQLDIHSRGQNSPSPKDTHLNSGHQISAEDCSPDCPRSSSATGVACRSSFGVDQESRDSVESCSHYHNKVCHSIGQIDMTQQYSETSCINSHIHTSIYIA
jgi:hypothetical protein